MRTFKTSPQSESLLISLKYHELMNAYAGVNPHNAGWV